MNRHSLFNWALVAIYYVLVVAPHKTFGTLLNRFAFRDMGMSRDQYNLLVIAIAGLGLLMYLVFFFRKTTSLEDRGTVWGYMLFNVLLATIVINILFVINIEVVHFPQYAMFALLIFPLSKNYNATLIWTTIAGAIDEAYQNFYLAPKDTGYYDWNDVITNLIGGVFGLLLLRSAGVSNRKISPFYTSKSIYGAIVLMVLVLVLHLCGVLSIGPSDYPYQMVSKELSGFWQTVHPNVTYHVVRPLEGLLITIGLWGVYRKIGG
ncbi:MAG: VanZ family protein [Bacteroidota bacterium]